MNSEITTEARTYTIPGLPTIRISDTARIAAGFGCYTNVDSVSIEGRSVPLELIALGIGTTGHADDRAVYWACAEHRRRLEESLRTGAMGREAQAISELAASIRASNEQNALDSILSRLSEKTQYAVRAQLKR